MDELDEKSTQPTNNALLEALILYLGILRRYWILITVCTGLPTLAITAYMYYSTILPPEKSYLPNTYTAQAAIIVQQENQTDIGQTILSSMGISQDYSYSTQDKGDLILEILKSRTIIDKLVNEFDIVEKFNITQYTKTKSRQLILLGMATDYQKYTGIIRISYESSDPAFAANIINRELELLDEWFRTNTDVAKQKQRKLLEDKINEVKTDIRNYQERIKALQKKYGVLTVQELGASQASSIANLRTQLILKEIEIKNYASFSKIDDPRLDQLKTERQNLIDLIDQNQESVFKNFETTETRQSIPDVAQQFTQLSIELDIQQRIYNTLSPQLEAAKLTTETAPAFQVLEWAEIPDIKSGPQRPKFILIGAGGALAGSIGLSLLLNYLKKFFGNKTMSAKLANETRKTRK